MAGREQGWLARLSRRRAARDWALLAQTAPQMRRGEVSRALRDEARLLQRSLRDFLRATSPRSQVAQETLGTLDLPDDTDWRWRPTLMAARTWRLGLAAPDSGRRLGQEMRIWHDGGAGAPLILRQTANIGTTDLAPFGVVLESFGFAGSYVSLTFDLPPESAQGLTRSHILRIEAQIGAESEGQGLMARLNITHGPNTDTVTLPMHPPGPGPAEVQVAEFDLSDLPINETQISKLWLDLILDHPRMNVLHLRDLIVSRHRRAAL
ncbi:MAG: DUF6478 family protein [Paracoccus sp. (in: a-proteobacteria)]|uniref:DUF6478 family protein n=1 Tax=Paracoccus sp. TaxID=267 RepID=UPI0026DFB294|nr:DUF6478 family protein [Paracoccus sp. (in: a-proteobacteria)]MDO5613090.1 DUF6478 family protein [Paracoccus sp. (in: a-proteobacteria)]